MTTARPSPDEDFDVGSRGLTGHYDTMVGKLRQATPRAVLAVAVWLWVFSWPPDTVIFSIGPVLTLGLVAKLALAAWSAWACAPLFSAFWYWTRWRALESAGLKTMVRNDLRLRVIAYDRRTDHVTLDQTTQQQRIEATRVVTHTRRSRLVDGLKRLAIGLAYLVAIPIGFFLLPGLTGHRFGFLTATPDFPRMAEQALANGDAGMAHWYSRLDVQGVFGVLTVEGVAIWLLFFLVVVPRLSDVFWHLYELTTQQAGNQYVPGAQVFEPVAAAKTIEQLRDQKIHGDVRKPTPAEAARQMRR